MSLTGEGKGLGFEQISSSSVGIVEPKSESQQ